jgi:hypothetical protein
MTKAHDQNATFASKRFHLSRPKEEAQNGGARKKVVGMPQTERNFVRGLSINIFPLLFKLFERKNVKK